jgi:hypothetical protein
MDENLSPRLIAPNQVSQWISIPVLLTLKNVAW